MKANFIPAAEKHSKESLRLWLRLLACESMIEQYIRTTMRQEFNITLPQFDVLAELEHMGRPLTMTELSTQLMVSNGNITGVIDRLVREAYVERLPSPGDRRVQLITLTKKGMVKFSNIALQHESWIADAFAEMEIDDMLQLTSLLNKTGDRLKLKFGKSARCICKTAA